MSPSLPSGLEAVICHSGHVAQALPLLRVLQDRCGHRVPSRGHPPQQRGHGRIIKCVVELNTYSIEFRSRPTIKSQALVDFVAKWTEIQEPMPATCPKHWVMYFDGAFNINDASVGILFITPIKDKL